jgi:tetratricopeptide (TPR) repeat protein
MKNKILILLIVAFSVLNGMAQEDKSLGKLYLDDLQYHQARDFFQKLLKASQNDIWIYCSLGDAYIGLLNPDSAKIMYQKAFAIDPKNPFVLIGLGKMALLSGDHQSELDFFDKAKRADRKNPAVYCKIAEECYDLTKKDTVTGSLYLTMGMEINSKFAGFHMVTGDWEAYKKNYGKAANAYERAIFFEPNSILAHRKLAEIYAAARFNRQSLDEYNKCIAINPDQILIYKDLGDLFYSLGRYAEAEKNYKIYMGKAEVSMDDKERYAIILFFNKKYNEAAGLLDNVLTKNTDESVLLRIRAYIAYETGDYKNGLDYMTKFFKLHNPARIIPSDHLYHGRLLEKNGNELQAMENYKKAYALDSTKTDILADLAKLSSKNKMYPQAIDYYYKMIANGFDKVNSYYSIGREAYFEGQIYKDKIDSLFKLQKKSNIPFSDSTVVRDSMKLWFQKADSAFTKVTQLSPDYAGGFLWKGRMESRLDPESETNVGKEAYEKALAIFEKDPEKNRRSIIECYKYLGMNAYWNSERLLKTDKQQSEALKNTTMEYFQKVLTLDPADAQATEVITELKKPEAKKRK